MRVTQGTFSYLPDLTDDEIKAHDPRHGRRTIALQFMVHRPKEEPGFRLDRVETNDRHIAYTLHSYAAEKPHDERYSD